MTTDTTHLSGPMLDYYAALAENMPNPRLRKHERENAYICVISFKAENGKRYPHAYSPTTNPALALPIIDKLIKNFFDFERDSNNENLTSCASFYSGINFIGDNITEAALRALVAWKFPDGLPEPIYESEK